MAVDTTTPDRGYSQSAADAARDYAAHSAMATQTRQTQRDLLAAAEAGTATEEERRRAREEQERLAAESAGTEGVDAESRQAQVEQTEYLRELQESGGAQALTAEQQKELAAQLAAQASGAVEGAGQLQLRRALEATQAATAAQIGSLRGMNPAAAQRLLAQQQSGQMQASAGQSAIVALEEQGEAQKQLAGLLGTMRGQDIASQESMAQQMAAMLTSTRQGDIASGTLDLQRDQLAAQILEAMRTGDTAALQTAIGAAQGQRQQDIAQAQLDTVREMGYVDAQGRVDIASLQARVQEELARIDREFKQGLIDQQRADEERKYWRDLLVNMQLGAQAGAGAAMMQTAARGGRIRGRGPGLVPGDHPANDVVPAMLSPGEIVIPRSIAQAEDAPEKAAAFVRALQREESKPLSRRAAAERIAELEAEIAALRAVKAGKERR